MRRFSDDDMQARFDRHLELANKFLHGTEQPGKHVRKRVFLSADTKPSEKEGREALCRILQYLAKTTEVGALNSLADMFEPDGKSERKIVFKRRSQGHSDPLRDNDIEDLVFNELLDLSQDPPVPTNKTLREAYEIVSDKTGLGPEQIKKIYSKFRKRSRS